MKLILGILYRFLLTFAVHTDRDEGVKVGKKYTTQQMITSDVTLFVSHQVI